MCRVVHVVCRRHSRAGMLFMSASRVAGGGVIGRRGHLLAFGTVNIHCVWSYNVNIVLLDYCLTHTV